VTELKLGVDLSFAKKRWPEPEAWLEVVSKRLGLKYVEFDSDFLDPLYISEPTRSDIALEVRRLASQYNVEIHNYFTGGMTHCVNLLSHPDERVRKEGLIWCAEAIDVAGKLGCRGIGGHFDTISSTDLANPERYNLLLDNLISMFQHLSVIASEKGQEFILWEQMYAPSEVPYTIEQTRQLMEKVNDGASVDILLTLDTGHACCQNFAHDPEDRNPYNWLKRFAPISPVVHIQQTNSEESCHWPFTKKYNERGIIEAEKVIEAIQSSGAKEVFLILEIFFGLGQPDQQVLDEMAESVEYWREYVKE